MRKLQSQDVHHITIVGAHRIRVERSRGSLSKDD